MANISPEQKAAEESLVREATDKNWTNEQFDAKLRKIQADFKQKEKEKIEDEKQKRELMSSSPISVSSILKPKIEAEPNERIRAKANSTFVARPAPQEKPNYQARPSFKGVPNVWVQAINEAGSRLGASPEIIQNALNYADKPQTWQSWDLPKNWKGTENWYRPIVPREKSPMVARILDNAAMNLWLKERDRQVGSRTTTEKFFPTTTAAEGPVGTVGGLLSDVNPGRIIAGITSPTMQMVTDQVDNPLEAVKRGFTTFASRPEEQTSGEALANIVGAPTTIARKGGSKLFFEKIPDAVLGSQKLKGMAEATSVKNAAEKIGEVTSKIRPKKGIESKPGLMAKVLENRMMKANLGDVISFLRRDPAASKITDGMLKSAVKEVLAEAPMQILLAEGRASGYIDKDANDEEYINLLLGLGMSGTVAGLGQGIKNVRGKVFAPRSADVEDPKSIAWLKANVTKPLIKSLSEKLEAKLASPEVNATNMVGRQSFQTEASKVLQKYKDDPNARYVAKEMENEIGKLDEQLLRARINSVPNEQARDEIKFMLNRVIEEDPEIFVNLVSGKGVRGDLIENLNRVYSKLSSHPNTFTLNDILKARQAAQSRVKDWERANANNPGSDQASDDMQRLLNNYLDELAPEAKPLRETQHKIFGAMAPIQSIAKEQEVSAAADIAKALKEPKATSRSQQINANIEEIKKALADGLERYKDDPELGPLFKQAQRNFGDYSAAQKAAATDDEIIKALRRNKEEDVGLLESVLMAFKKDTFSPHKKPQGYAEWLQTDYDEDVELVGRRGGDVDAEDLEETAKTSWDEAEKEEATKELPEVEQDLIKIKEALDENAVDKYFAQELIPLLDNAMKIHQKLKKPTTNVEQLRKQLDAIINQQTP